jgi:hypothetical protein
MQAVNVPNLEFFRRIRIFASVSQNQMSQDIMSCNRNRHYFATVTIGILSILCPTFSGYLGELC